MRAFLIASAVAFLVACSGGTTAPSARSSPSAPAAPSPAHPLDLSSLQGRIVFSDETRDIWSMRADGTHVRRLTTDPAMEFDPTWSPDGRRIAYRHQTGDLETGTGGAIEIYVMDVNGSHQRRLTHNRAADWGPDWSPDGRWILWNSSMGTGGYPLRGYVMAPDGSQVRRISGHYVEYPAWSPDGTQIALMAPEPGASGSNPDYNIFVMDADGSHVRRLTTAPGEDGWPAWSPDGTEIVFSSARDDCTISDAADCRTTGDIGPWEDAWIVNADGSEQHRLTSEFAQFFAWSPDGSAIFVTGDRPFMIRPDGSGLTPVSVPGVAHPLFPDWVSA